MKRAIAGLIAGLVLGTAATVVAATTSGWSHRQDGVWCKDTNGNIACIPTTATGYGIGISTSGVLVMNVDTSKVIFKRYQP